MPQYFASCSWCRFWRRKGRGRGLCTKFWIETMSWSTCEYGEGGGREGGG